MRWLVLVLVCVLAACGPKDGGGTGGGTGDGTGGGAHAAPFAAVQKIVDGVAAKHADLQRLTVHAVPSGKTACTQVASTMAERRGKPSDPEDLEALETGQEIVLDEPGAVDLTVPILVVDGKPTAIAGVTLAMEDDDDHDARVDAARAIAQELEKELQAAAKPLW